MKKNLSYRDKLLELATIYRVSEIKNYLKNKRYLTTPQLEHILKKNKVPIPTEINKSLLEIQVKKITKPVYSTGNKISNFLFYTKKGISRFFLYLLKVNINFFLSIYEGILKASSFVSKLTMNSLNSIYNFKSQDRKGNKFVTASLSISFLALLIIAGFNVVDVIKDTKTPSLILEKQAVDAKEEKSLPKKKAEPKKMVKTPEDKPKEKKLAKIPEKSQKKTKDKSKEVREFVLPNLNLKTETVLSLFEDVQYDLKKVRYEKKVRPIYFTQFPKDLDEIGNVKLKKDTFIKIILPLVAAENQKILNDRYKLGKILKKREKIRTKKEKLWLNIKSKEYKVKKEGDYLELQKRMDIIPISIALAQAAKESGWGTSRFALEGNAIFGQWTWTGTGIAPLDRSKEKNHKILRFPILRASVKAYKNNLNSHKSYKDFREKRFLLRKKNKTISGLKLIHTLDNYAETGKEYTKILGQIIEQNSLTDFENVILANTVVKKQLEL
tara:strand:- start:696 stop:2186 length:1491 start_codon:yes stop_codon:yes gene_type:complete